MMGDFARVQRADFAPGDCIRCDRDEDLLDLGAESIQMYGRVYLCTVCFSELADALTFVSPEINDGQRRSYEARITEMQKTITEQATKMAVLEVTPTPTEASIARLIHDIRSAVDVFDSGVSDLPVPVVSKIAAKPSRGRARSNVRTVEDPARATAASGGAPAGFDGFDSGDAAGTHANNDGRNDGHDQVDGDSDDERAAATTFDVDDWVAGLREFDGEDPQLSTGDVGD